MKILRVRFESFGPFDDQGLDFGTGDGLHVVYGPNEAGKSSALRGLHAMLFGFPHRTTDDYRHKTSDFRVHGLLQSAAGERLECVRRKGIKGTLRAPDDKTVLPDSTMVAMLGGLDEEQFQQLFGLDLDRLQEGGDQIAQGKGHLGEALFAAGAGMKGLRVLAARLLARQEALYKSTGYKQRIRESLKELAEQNDLIKKSLLPVEEYEQAERADREARERVAELRKQRDAVRAEINLLTRYQAALPLIDMLLAARQRLAGVAAAPLLPDGFDEQLTQARTDRIKADSKLAGIVAEQAKLSQQLDADAPPPAILAEQAEIEAVRALVAAQATFAAKRIEAETFSVDQQNQARTLYRELTGSKDWEQMSALKPRDRDRSIILRLANEESGVRGDVATRESAARAARDALAEAERLLAAAPEVADPAAWQSAIDLVRDEGPLAKQADALRADLARTEATLSAEFARFHPAAPGRWADAGRVAVPPAELIQRFAADEAAAARAVADAERLLADHDAAITAAELNVDRIRAGDPVPGVAELTTARHDRDAGLQLVRQRIERAPDELAEAAFADRYTPDRPIMDAVEAAGRGCDQIADRMRLEADRLARLQAAEAELAGLHARRPDLARALGEAREAANSLSAKWVALWKPAGIVTESPAVMQAWHTQWTAFAQRVTAWAGEVARLKELDAKLASLTQRLGLACPAALAAGSLAEALAAAQRAVTDATARREARAKHVAEVERCRKSLVAAEQSLAESKKRLADWQAAWAPAVRVLGLDDAAVTAEVAQDYLQKIDTMQSLLKDSRIHAARARDMQNEADALLVRWNLLRQRLEPGSKPSSPESLDADFRAVDARLQAAIRQQVRHTQLVEQSEKLAASRTQAADELAAADARLTALAAVVNAAMPEAITEAVQRSRERAVAEREIAEKTRELAPTIKGVPLDAFVSAAVDARVGLEARLTGLDDEVARLDAAVSDAENLARTAAERLSQYQKASATAADANQQAALVAARLTEQSLEFAGLHVAQLALARAIERYRARHQDSMLERAGEFFRTLTEGKFAGIEVDSDEGVDVLLAVRADGRSPARVKPDGLSVGTRDQLFLALRLAGIARHLAEREPVPLMIDDVLVNFDDGRAAATLRCLTELAAGTQVVLFSHHGHVAELARGVGARVHTW